MSNMKRALILGDGAAGTIISNKLRLLTDRNDLEVVVIGNSTKHYFKPDGVQIPFSLKQYKKSVKPTEFLFNSGVQYIPGEDCKNVSPRLRTPQSPPVQTCLQWQ